MAVLPAVHTKIHPSSLACGHCGNVMLHCKTLNPLAYSSRWRHGIMHCCFLPDLADAGEFDLPAVSVCMCSLSGCRGLQDQAWLRALIADAALNRFKHLEAGAGLRNTSAPGAMSRHRNGKNAAAGKSWDDLGQPLHGPGRNSPFEVRARLFSMSCPGSPSYSPVSAHNVQCV